MARQSTTNFYARVATETDVFWSTMIDINEKFLFCFQADGSRKLCN